MSEQLYTRRLALAASTLDMESRTAEATIASDAAVLRDGQRPDGSRGRWYETLNVSNANLERIINGPVLLDHNHHSAEARIGVVESVRREGSQLVAQLRFSDREEVTRLLVDLRSGIGGAISVGYTVEEWSTS